MQPEPLGNDFIEPAREHGAAAIPMDDAFEQLRQAFRTRLRGDRIRLTTLGTELARTTAAPAPIFRDIQMFAHKLRGAAAIFDAAEVADAAKALELAATAASLGQVSSADRSVWMTLETLADRLAAITEEEIPSDHRRMRARRRD